MPVSATSPCIRRIDQCRHIWRQPRFRARLIAGDELAGAIGDPYADRQCLHHGAQEILALFERQIRLATLVMSVMKPSRKAARPQANTDRTPVPKPISARRPPS